MINIDTVNEIESYLIHLINSNLYLYIILVVLIERIRKLSTRNLITSWFFIFPGVFLHEVSHYLISFCLNGKPNKFSIIPGKENLPNGKLFFKFGNVFHNNLKWFNRFFIGMSPLLLIFCIYYLNKYYFSYVDDSLLANLLFIYIVIILTNSAIPSSSDFLVAFEGYGYVLSLILLISIFYFSNKFNLISLNI
jgi:hypothetical protein